MTCALLLLPAADYRIDDFLTVAQEMNVELVYAANGDDRRVFHTHAGPVFSVPFDPLELAAERVLAALGSELDAVVAVDHSGLGLAALLNQKLGLDGNSVAAVHTPRDKFEFRQLQKAYAFNCPRFQTASSDAEAVSLAPALRYPVVVKARRLSGRQGVVRADDAAAYMHALARVRRIQVAAGRDARELDLLVESFIPGRQYALEGLLQHGALRVMAFFDMPDPPPGPNLVESVYVTPSRLPAPLQPGIAADVQRACALTGLTTGPVHAEVRVNAHGTWLLDVAPCVIADMCARVLRHRLGMTLEEFVLRNALDMPMPIARDEQASGVMKIPIPKRGIFSGVAGLASACAVAGIIDVRITAQAGEIVIPPPEGSTSLGYIFSRAHSPEAVEAALRTAHERLSIDIQAEMPVASASL